MKKTNFQQHPQGLRARKGITIVTQQVKIIFAHIRIQRLLLPDIPTSMFYFNLLFLGETITDIARRLVSNTDAISLARFPTGRAIIVGIKWVAEVTAFRLSCLCTSLVGRHFYCNQKIRVETRKTHKDIKYSRNTYPELPKILQNVLCNKLKQMTE